MFLWMIVKAALRSLWAHKLRSFLAMLGIIIGVGAVIGMLAMGAGAQEEVYSRFARMGTNLLWVTPAQRTVAGVASGHYQSLVPADGLALLEIPGVRAATPVVRGSEQVKFFGSNARVGITGGAATFFEIRNFDIEFGEAFADLEVERNARVAVIGPVTADNLFKDHNPLGQNIKIRGINFRVIGIYRSKGADMDDQIIIPYTTAMRQLLGVTFLREMNIQCADGVDQALVQQRVQQLLRERHRVQEGAADHVVIRNQAEIMEAYAGVARTLTLLMGSVATMALMVGGIGIMNIMLVSVTERTREIGIRKAVGARDSDVLGQFLIESLIMSGIGGLFGLGFGVVLAQVLEYVTTYPAIIQVQAVALAMGFSIAVGIFFGYYPAIRAARLDPIESLRYE